MKKVTTIAKAKPMKQYKSLDFKLYLNKTQEATLERWLRVCCWVYNKALEQRIKAWKRRKESVGFYDQSKLLTKWRSSLPFIKSCPVDFERDALRRVDRGMQAFFRRCKSGGKPGFPRFRSYRRYESLEILASLKYVQDKSIYVPKLGPITARGRFEVDGKQRALRVIKRASGWYAQVLVEQEVDVVQVKVEASVGVDVGLNHFAAFSDGELIANPRLLKHSQKQIKRHQQSVCRKKKGSRNRLKAIKLLARRHEKLQSQRKGFAHQLSRKLVNEHDLIAIEDLNIKGLAGGMLAKSINDAAWGIFFFYLSYKAANAGKVLVKVDPSGTSQTCPGCGTIKRKSLNERVHYCTCAADGMDRDVASAKVILNRAMGVAVVKPVEGLAAVVKRKAKRKVSPKKQVVQK